MDTTCKIKAAKTVVLLSFIVMATVNILANALPLNGIKTGEVSSYYKNLFTPAGYTFAIWGLIYILLATFVLYQFGLFGGSSSTASRNLITKIVVPFVISSLANAFWVFFWHYDFIPLSMLMMVIILLCLISINKKIKKAHLTGRDKVFIKLPFSIYFAWITVATIANAAVFLVYLNWDGFGIPENIWTMLMLCLSALIGAATAVVNRDIPYGAVFAWAYAGIFARHISPSGYAWIYPSIAVTAAACAAFIVCVLVYIAAPQKRIS